VGGKCSRCVTFYFDVILFFSGSRPGKTPGSIVAQKRSKDGMMHTDAFWGLERQILRIGGHFGTKTSQNWPGIGRPHVKQKHDISRTVRDRLPILSLL